MADAGRHGLQFLGEARANDLQPGTFTPEVMQRVKELEGASEIVREQYKDFIRGCSFRETLLCHSELEISSNLLVDRVPRLYASCDAILKEGGNQDGKAALFRRTKGAELETTVSFDLGCISVSLLAMACCGFVRSASCRRKNCGSR